MRGGRTGLIALLVALVVVVAGTAAVARTLTGTNRDDVITGTNRADVIVGRGGQDVLKGRRGRDRIRAGTGADVVRGGRGRDKLRGHGGPDVIIGGQGTDKLFGGRGRDGLNVINGVLQGSPGNDVIRARDGQADEIDCAAGFDTVYVDRIEDGVYNCEKVIGPGREDIGEHVPPEEAE